MALTLIRACGRAQPSPLGPLTQLDTDPATQGCTGTQTQLHTDMYMCAQTHLGTHNTDTRGHIQSHTGTHRRRHTCTHGYTGSHTDIQGQTITHSYTETHTDTDTHIQTHLHTHTHIHGHTNIDNRDIHIDTCIDTETQTCKYRYTQTHTHAAWGCDRVMLGAVVSWPSLVGWQA